MEQRKGISLASVVIATVVIMLLTTTITISVKKILENSDKISFASEIDTLQTSINSYYLAEKEYPTLGENIVIDITKIDEKNIFKDENIVDGKVILNKIDYDKINYVSLKYGTSLDEGDIYAISEITGKVYYVKGIKIGNTTYFTLTEELEKLLSKGKKKRTKSDNLVIFIPSQIGWSNESVGVTVKIPKSCTNISVISGIDSYSLSREEENYYVYYVEKNGNYLVEVRYKNNNGKIKEAKYTVDNYDIQKPNINIDSHIVLGEENNNEFFGYYNILSMEDDLSGVKQVKYEYGKINENVYNYFKSNGEVVKDNKIMIKRGYEYITVYIEDNATNYNVVYIKI